MVAEYNESGQLIQSYGYKPNSLYTADMIFTHRPDFTEELGYAFYINDHLGKPQKLILRNGRKVWEASADSFGKTIVTNNEFKNSLGLPGQYNDDESGFDYNYFRYYDSQLGRYITSDPIGLGGGVNTYAYVYQNPINLIDVFGLISNCAQCKYDCAMKYEWDIENITYQYLDNEYKCRLKVARVPSCQAVSQWAFTWSWDKLKDQFTSCMKDCDSLGDCNCPIDNVPKYQPVPEPTPEYHYPPNDWTGGNPFRGPMPKPPYQWPSR